jgi:alkylation response protein AidB-like acyl-CoA dehydrogenase
MMDFELNEEQKMLSEAIRRLSSERIRKVFRDADEEGHIPEDVVQAGWEMGLVASGIPEVYGGFGEHSAVTGAIAMEEFAYGDLAVTFNIGVPGLVAIPVLLAGTDTQKETYLPQFCQENRPAMTAALTEPVIQFDPYKLGTKAVREDDDFVLNGVKTMVPLAETADLILVYAEEDGRTQAFFVPTDTEGLEISKREKLMGVRALPVHALTLADCRVPIENKLGGEEGIDFGRILNHSRVALGAAAVGMARAGYEYARDYAKNRVQFGEPIAYRQSIAFMLADMAIDVDAARLLVWEAAYKLDKGEDATRETAVMKNYVDNIVLNVADRSVQTLGGYGYIREFPAELWLRNARGFATFDGMAMV